MRILCLGLFSLCLFLVGCEKPADEMEDLELMVQLDEDENVEWSNSENKMLGQETPVFEIPLEDFR